MNEQNKNELATLISAIKNGVKKIEVDPYPISLEPTIRLAVEEKRNGQYDEAIRLYLEIFKKPSGLNADIMAFLFKVLVCDGELVKAQEIIRYAEEALISQVGEKAPLRLFPNGPVMGCTKWKQTVYRDDLYNACNEGVLRFNGKISIPTFGVPVSLLQFARSMSGNPDFSYTCSHEKLAQEIGMVVITENMQGRKV